MLVKWRPFDEITRFEREINKMFSNTYGPAIDVCEDTEKVTIEAEVPGMGSENIDITVDKNIITIKGEKTKEEKTTKKEYWCLERSAGSFTRSFTLPSSVETEKIQAFYDRGILTIHVPKKPEVVPKKIEIKTTG